MLFLNIICKCMV